jgi:hypothetical protein
MNLHRRTLLTGLTAASASLLTSCGTLIYPERRSARSDGTMGKEIDFLILGLDAVGLIFFLIPGLIAFAVDFGTGAIFLPEGGKQMNKNEPTIFNDLSQHDRINTPVQPEELEKVLAKHTGRKIDLHHPQLMGLAIDHIGEAPLARIRLLAQSMMAAR